MPDDISEDNYVKKQKSNNSFTYCHVWNLHKQICEWKLHSKEDKWSHPIL